MQVFSGLSPLPRERGNCPSNFTALKLVFCLLSWEMLQNATTLEYCFTVQLLTSFLIEWRSFITWTVGCRGLTSVCYCISGYEYTVEATFGGYGPVEKTYHLCRRRRWVRNRVVVKSPKVEQEQVKWLVTQTKTWFREDSTYGCRIHNTHWVIAACYLDLRCFPCFLCILLGTYTWKKFLCLVQTFFVS